MSKSTAIFFFIAGVADVTMSIFMLSIHWNYGSHPDFVECMFNMIGLLFGAGLIRASFP